MPAYLRDELLSREEIEDVVTYVESLGDNSIQATENGATGKLGAPGSASA